jgi:tellurite methyltransferase
MDKNQFWQRLYAQGEDIWGDRPDSALLDYEFLVPSGKILDLGIGEGRNALYFASQGHDVSGVDLSEIAVQRCRERASALQVPIQVEVGNLLDVHIQNNSYAMIMSNLTYHFLKQAEWQSVLARSKEGLRSGGLIYLTVFSTADGGYARAKNEKWEEVEANTFYRQASGDYVHYFDKDELLTQVSDLKLIYLAEVRLMYFALYRVFDPGHPNLPEPFYHNELMYIGQKI